MKNEINNGVVLDAVEIISKHCESTTYCDNCILKKICLTVLIEKPKSIPYYWMNLLSKKG